MASDAESAGQLSWNDAHEYCRWLSEQEKTEYRLPTEGEWEYACRAGTTTFFNWGDDPTLMKTHTRHPTGPKVAPNGFGLYDMHGNHWEWCLDVMALYSETEVVDPVTLGPGVKRQKRGGAYV